MTSGSNSNKPSSKEPSSKDLAPREEAVVIPTGGKRSYDRTSYILVVDDDNTLLKFFKIHLNKFFSRVIVVKNAKEAIDTLREKEIDLVLSDIRMPRMDGFALMKRVRKHDPSIPMLLISGALLTDEQSRAAVDEADGYLRKPFSVDDLHNFIELGMQLRDKYKMLSEFLSDKKQIRDVLRGKSKLEKVVANAKHLKEATDLLEEIRSGTTKQAG